MIDPTLSGEALEALAQRDILAALSHPNAAEAQLIRWVKESHAKYTIRERLDAVLQNPYLALSELEDPSDKNPLLLTIWREKANAEVVRMQQMMIPDQRAHGHLYLFTNDQRRYLLSVLQEKLPWFEANVPTAMVHLVQGALQDLAIHLDTGKSIPPLLLISLYETENPLCPVIDALEAESGEHTKLSWYAQATSELIRNVSYSCSYSMAHLEPDCPEGWEWRWFRFFTSYLARLSERFKEGSVTVGMARKRVSKQQQKQDEKRLRARNVHTPVEELMHLLGDCPDEVLANPNCPALRLEWHAGNFPMAVSLNPALPLIALDRPDFYERIQQKLIRGWLDEGSNLIHPHGVGVVAQIVREIILPSWQRSYPQNPGMAQLVTELEAFDRVYGQGIQVQESSIPEILDALEQELEDIRQREHTGSFGEAQALQWINVVLTLKNIWWGKFNEDALSVIGQSLAMVSLFEAQRQDQSVDPAIIRKQIKVQMAQMIEIQVWLSHPDFAAKVAPIEESYNVDS